LIEDRSAAAEAGVHVRLVIGWIEAVAGEGAEGGEAVWKVGAGMLRYDRQRQRSRGRPGGIGAARGLIIVGPLDFMAAADGKMPPETACRERWR
jgi:hypothetical protein